MHARVRMFTAIRYIKLIDTVRLLYRLILMMMLHVCAFECAHVPELKLFFFLRLQVEKRYITQMQLNKYHCHYVHTKVTSLTCVSCKQGDS